MKPRMCKCGHIDAVHAGYIGDCAQCFANGQKDGHSRCDEFEAGKKKQPHRVEPIEHERGRFRVESASAPGEWYVVDIFEEHQADGGQKVVGTCDCKGWSVRKTCSHLKDAREFVSNGGEAR